jgi:hypothetical protein
MEKLMKWLNWVDENLIKIMLVGYIFFMPLWPKLPIKMVEFTYIGIRGDDFYIAVFFIVFLVQVLRKKIELKTKFALYFFLFWTAIFISFMAGFFIQKTIDYPQLGFMHMARRVQYMVIFFMAMSTIKNKKDFYFYLYLVIGTLGIVSIYGIGQKYLGWPAIQTMNPEYAKGYVLVLEGEARISSTFAGHYDLAAYLTFLIPIVLGLYIAKDKIVHFLTYLFSLMAMVLTSSRTSFGSYILSTLPYLAFMRKFVLLLIAIVLTISFTFLSKDLTNRITRTFQSKTVFVDKNTGATVISQDINPNELPAGGIQIGKNAKDTKATKEDLDRLKKKLSKDISQHEQTTGKKLSKEEKDRLLAQQIQNLIPKKMQLFDISTSVRLTASWPRAIRAWSANYFLGSGPSSLGEASDGDYFRWLGEFGILGTGSFMLLLFMIAKYIWDYVRKNKPKDAAVYYGFLFGLFGLMINASYIDVFEASKLAYTFWLVAGLFVGGVYAEEKIAKVKVK